MTHICVGKLTILGSDNGLSPGRRQAIIWTNAGILLIGPLGTNFSEILIGILTFSFKKMRLKMSSVKWRPFCLGLNVLIWLTDLVYYTGSSCIVLGYSRSRMTRVCVSELMMPSLKWKCHFDEIFITGCNESCQNDNFRRSQSWKFRQNEVGTCSESQKMTLGQLSCFAVVGTN